MDKEIKGLLKNLSDVEDRNAKILKEARMMGSGSTEEEQKNIDQFTFGQIETKTKELYSICMADRADAKMGNASVL